MRTEKEIIRQIEGLEKEKERIPEVNYFGENNHEPIEIKIAIINGEAEYKDYEDEEYNIEVAAYDATEWLDDETYPDLFK